MNKELMRDVTKLLGTVDSNGNQLESSFTNLFGPNDHADGNESRSALSPSAYLVDLLQLRDSVNSSLTDYHVRRPDVRRIGLDQANTFTEIPFLDVANEVMIAAVIEDLGRKGNVVDPDPLAHSLVLAAELFPPPLPFSEQHFRDQLYAEKLGTSLDEIQRLYRSSVDSHTSARLRLGLSLEEYALFTTAHDSKDEEIEKLWHVDAPAKLDGSDLETIKRKLGLSLKELKQLVRQDLSESELHASAPNAAGSFFINQGPHHIVLDEAAGKLQLEGGGTLTNQHLDRMMRFVRLARRLDLELVDLDWLLQTACGNTLDEAGLQAIAIALELCKIGDVAIDEICSLWRVPKDHGLGDGAVPADLFDRVYNNGFSVKLAELVKSVVQAHLDADGLDDRLQATLRLSGADFAFLKAALLAGGLVKPQFDYADANNVNNAKGVIAWFSAFRRIATLSAMLSLSVQDVMMLFDVLGAQWAVSEHDDLDIAMPFAAALTTTPLALLLAPDDKPPRRTLNVLQKLVRVKQWLDLRELSPRQLAYICLEDHFDARRRLDDGTLIDDVQPDDAIESALDSLHQSLHDTMLAPSALQTGSLTAKGARAVFDSLVGARALKTFDDPGRALLRVQPSEAELLDAMQAGIHERLEVHAGDVAALGITDLDPLFSLLRSHGYVERVDETVDDERQVHHFIAPGLANYFAAPNSAAAFTIPNFQDHAAAVFAALAAQVDDAAQVDAADLAAAGIDSADVPQLFQVLQAHGHVEPVSNGYRVTADHKAFFANPANSTAFVLPDFSVVFAVLAAKVEAFQRAEANRKVEAQEVGGRLTALSDQQARTWLQNLSGLLGLSADAAELAFAWAFGTPDETMTQTLAALTLPLFAAKQRSEPALHDAYLASRFRRLQQLALLLRKTAMTADEARVYLTNQQVHRRLPETLKVPDGFLAGGKIDALTTLPGGDFLIISGQKFAAFSRQDYHRLGKPSDPDSLDHIPGVTLSGAFLDRVQTKGLDATFSDTGTDGKPVLQLCAGDQYVTVSDAGTSSAKPISDWGKVRNNIQKDARVDAAVQAKDGRLFLFSGDQYFRYSNPQQLVDNDPQHPAFLDERYPKSIRGKFESEGVSPLPAVMFSRVDAAFRDTDDTYFFFAGNRYIHSTDPYNLLKIRIRQDPHAPLKTLPGWGHVLNYVFEDNRVDAAFVLAGVTYLTRRNQLTRYSGAYEFVDEGFPISFGNIADSQPLGVLRRFQAGLDAALAGSDGRLYAFKAGAYASSAAPDTSLVIRDHWGRVRNVFIDNERVDAALTYSGAVYLFCGDQYVRYTGASYEFVDEGYPLRVRPNWNALEGIGSVPDGLPLPITAVAVGRAPGGTSDDVYFFGGNQFAGPGGALGDIKAQWARVRNNIIERVVGVVDAAMVDGTGRMFLFSGDQYYRYSSPDQMFVDETYPLRLTGNWANEGSGYALPDAFADGISAALRTAENKVWFFSGQSYARVDTAPATPRSNSADWGVVQNWIQSHNKVSAAFVDAGKTYVLGGDQLVRYTGTNYDVVDEGFPLKISTRWPSLPDSFRSDIDAALVFTSPIDNKLRLYLFKGDSYCRLSGDFTQLDVGYPKLLKNAAKKEAEGEWFRGLAVHEPDDHLSHDDDDDEITSVEATYVDTFAGKPRIFVFYVHEGGSQWRREYRNGKWLAPSRVEHLDDYEPFHRLDAAFVATDGTLYAFSGNEYTSRPPAGGPRTAPAAIQTRWARVFNQFATLGRVDACLTLPDGRTYLFCATQFIRYTVALQPGAIDFCVDEGYPLRIDPNWPAQGVPVTLEAEFQVAGYDLCRDATGKIHFFKAAKYTFSGNKGPDLVLSSRWGKVENRFQDLDRVDAAYRAENNKLYLFCDTQYTRYSGALQPGSPEFHADEGYPRHVTTGWSTEGLAIAMPAQWNALGSAVFRDAQLTYVFSGASFTNSQTPPPPALPPTVIPQWAKVRNQIQAQNRVDAGFVLAGVGTLVFCDDQYVRYSAGYDRPIDEGYPKVIAHLTAADGAFPGLPVELQSGLRGFFAGTDGKLHAFAPQPSDDHQPQRYVSSASATVLRPLNEQWGIVDNKLWDNEFVNAALLANDKLFLFSGNQYVRYSRSDRVDVDEGYPRKIASSYAKEIGAAALAPIMHQGVDAALTIAGTTFYFVQDQYVATDHPDVSHPLVNRWGVVNNRLQASQKLDAAFVAPSGKLYLFADTQVSVYSGAARLYVDEEFPQKIATEVGALWPPEFRAGLDAAASFEGRSYLFKDAQHVRISDFRLGQPESGYPRDIDGKFVDRFDFELGTLPDWSRIKQLFNDFSSQTTTVLDYLDDRTIDRVGGLALATQWPMDEIHAVLGFFGLAPGALIDGRAVDRLARCFELAGRLGTTPSRLKTQVWDLIFDLSPLPAEDTKRRLALAKRLAAAADFLYGLIQVATVPKDWPEVARSLLDPLESARRDALVPYLVESLGKRDANDLYAHLLTDVEMSASSTTTRILEAINSIQLFYHRALIHLETFPDDSLPATDTKKGKIRKNLNAWWPWMKNFRIWEANRKVFLHPENYIRPELRTEKSPEFEELEQKLLQDEITATAVQEGYQRYLETFNEISQLRIVGGYRYTYPDHTEPPPDPAAPPPERTAVFMIGVSRKDPPVYYYRFGTLALKEIDPKESIDWEPWQKVGITIDSDRVQPVYAFNRLFLFWIETKPFNANLFSSGGTYSADSPESKRVKLTVKFSFYNFTKEWVAPQTLRINPFDPAEPETLRSVSEHDALLNPILRTVFSPEEAADVVLTARNPAPTGGGDKDFIYLTFRHFIWQWDLGRLTAGLDLELPTPLFLFWQPNGILTDPKTLFPTQTGIQLGDLSDVVPWGAHVESGTDAWLSFDAKGGTFLCRPVNAAPTIPFNKVSGAFSTDSGDVFVFNLEAQAGVDTLCFHHYNNTDQAWQAPVFVDQPTWPWGRPNGVFQQFPAKRIENVVLGFDGITYFLLGSDHFTYGAGVYGATIEHYATELTPGSPSLDQLTGGGLAPLSWQNSVAGGRSLTQAFKIPGTDQAILVTQDGGGPRGIFVAGLDGPNGLKNASADHNGHSPFDSWDGLDTVFQVDAPLRVVFSRGTKLVTYQWSSKTWTTEALSALPGGAAGLSTAFTGVDGNLYLFCNDRYAKVDPATLTAPQVFAPVVARWGRPSLFSWLVSSVEGALLGPDSKLYLFAGHPDDGSLLGGQYCLRYTGFDPTGLDGLVLDDHVSNPPKVPDVWLSDINDKQTLERVTAAFARNGRAYLFGKRSDGSVFVALYSPPSQSPFRPDAGYPRPVPGVVANRPPDFSADFYAGFLAVGQRYSITRLTSHTSEQFGRRLFAGGIPKLLSLDTQLLSELPKFTPTPTAAPDELFVNAELVIEYPGKDSTVGLDFASANGFYYWEIFFHIPYLIAQTLKQEQRFDDARRWYEYVFDPTSQDGNAKYWRYLPFEADLVPDPSKLDDQVRAYHDDPFDPHKIAELRPIAYRKAFVMSYIDNLLEWGDMLFRQYTRETIGEATMLYVRAADLLGKKPEPLGKRAMFPPDVNPPDSTLSYEQIRDFKTKFLTAEILELENGVPQLPPGPPQVFHTPNDSIFNPYFYIPENDQFVDFWNRVGDRLTKIRNGLNIDGVKQALPLLAPPVDVMALVQAFASGAGLAQTLADYQTPVPHYRFAFMLGRARELVARVIGLGGALLSALEKKDAEELSLLRNTQERSILEMQLDIKQQQLEGARQSLAALQEGLKNAQARNTHYQELLDAGLSGHEQAQIGGMIVGQVFSQISNVLSVAGSIGSFLPNVGSPFAITYGGIQVGAGIQGLSTAFRALAEMASFQSSLAATLGGWERRSQDWQLQQTLATGDTLQIGRQIKAAEIQVEIASQEIQVQRRQIKNNQSIDTFMNSKFTSRQLYQFMVGKLSAVYFQTYHLALSYAKSAQRAMQFELGLPETDVKYIGAGYWDSLKKGLTAGEQLQLDLDRLEKAHCDTNERRMEITRYVSLIQVDPLALLRLKERGSCEFELTEALFDGDFPGHYNRQLKSVSLSFPAVIGPYHNFNATLTQLGHRTLLTADKPGLKYLLGQTAAQPLANILRVDWRPNQQVALSIGTNDGGLFQVDYHDERYLPFEGTGAVSTWRLEINGVDGPLHRETLSDVIVTVRYTARTGGSAFAETVKSALGDKTRDRAWLLNLAFDFPDQWQAFMNKPADGLMFAVDRTRLPGGSDGKVTGVYVHYDLVDDPVDDLSRQTVTLSASTGTPPGGIQLKPGAFKTGLSLPLLEHGQKPKDATWKLMPTGAAAAQKFSSQNLRTVALVVTYASKPSF